MIPVVAMHKISRLYLFSEVERWGWFESYLVAIPRRQVFSWQGSITLKKIFCLLLDELKKKTLEIPFTEYNLDTSLIACIYIAEKKGCMETVGIFVFITCFKRLDSQFNTSKFSTVLIQWSKLQNFYDRISVLLQADTVQDSVFPNS